MRHDPLTGLVFVDEDVVGRAVRRVGEDPELVEARRYDRVREPRGERRREQRVALGEGRRPGLQPSVRELRPAGEGGGLDLERLVG